MSETETHRYDYLRRKRYVVHEEHERFIRPETLAEMREYEAVEFYSRERIRELSQKGLIHHELKARIDDLATLRRKHPEGSNARVYMQRHDHRTHQQARPRRLSNTENRKNHR